MFNGITQQMVLMGLAGLLLCAMLLLLAWIDIKAGLLPDVLTLSLLWLGLLVNLNGLISPLDLAVLGAVVGYVFLWAANIIHRIRHGRDGMGYGDFKLTAALGAWFGITLLPWILLGACIAGYGASLARRDREAHLTKEVPFGPWLAVSGMMALFFVFSR